MNINATASPPSDTLQVRLENFRLFADSGWLDLAPLTCVVGRNSSGKSSLIAALLLLKQSIETEVFGSAITPLALSGEYCDLGQFRDVVHNHDEASELSFSFRLPCERLYESNSRSSALVSLSTPRAARVNLGSNRYVLPEGGFTISGPLSVRLTFSADQPFGPSLSRCEFDFPSIGKIRFVRTINGERRQHWRSYVPSTDLKPLVFIPTTRSFFPAVLMRDRLLKKLTSSQTSRCREVLILCRNFFNFLENLLRRSEMIGPFRQPPSRRYAFAGFGANRSGPSGEQAVDLLITEALLKRRGGQSLMNSVSYWLKALKLVDSLRVKDIARKLNLFEVDVRLAGRKVRTNIVDVGFGVSQVLPVLIQGLLMERGGIYFVQEPEIHLHPDAQAGLADFFLYLAYQGVTSVVETHSEYMLLRLRRRLAESPKPLRGALPKVRPRKVPLGANDISFLFSEAKGSTADITRLSLGPGFQFENLPAGFMSQISEDRMALLKAVSK